MTAAAQGTCFFSFSFFLHRSTAVLAQPQATHRSNKTAAKRHGEALASRLL
jgi:hypothetical protein